MMGYDDTARENDISKSYKPFISKKFVVDTIVGCVNHKMAFFGTAINFNTLWKLFNCNNKINCNKIKVLYLMYVLKHFH